MIKTRKVRWTEHAARMVEERNACRILEINPEGDRSLGRSGRR
jgi:hypothetical protein